jgi:hypothetical protein
VIRLYLQMQIAAVDAKIQKIEAGARRLRPWPVRFPAAAVLRRMSRFQASLLPVGVVLQTVS